MKLLQACIDQDVDTVRTLLNDPTIDPTTFEVIDGADGIQEVNAMHIISKNGNVEIMKLLLEDGRIDPELGGFVEEMDFLPPLHISSKLGHIEIVKLLLEDGRADPNANDNHEYYTPLMFACGENRIEIVKLLLNNPRVDINEVDSRSLNCLYICCVSNHYELVEIILTDPRFDKSDDLILYESYDTVCKLKLYEIIKLLILLIDNYTFDALNGTSNIIYGRDVDDILILFKGSPEYHRRRSKYSKDFYAGNLFLQYCCAIRWIFQTL